MKVSLMVEGQNGLTWDRWRHILELAERLKFPGVFRSDHYFIGQQQDSLDPYLSFAFAAEMTSTIRFRPAGNAGDLPVPGGPRPDGGAGRSPQRRALHDGRRRRLE